MKLSHATLALGLIIFTTACGGKNKTSNFEGNIKNETTKPSSVEEAEKGGNNSGGYDQAKIDNHNHSNYKKNEDEDKQLSFNATMNDVALYSTSNASTLATSDTVTAHTEDPNSKYNPLSSTGTTIGNDGIRKFIKTADLKFRVKSVVQATYDIEDITNRFGGFVASTRLQSNVDDIRYTAISRDSSLETVHYTVKNTMLLRIPEAKMDSALRAMSPLVDYMDHRNITVDDIHIQLIADQLAQTRLSKYQSRMRNSVDTKGGKLNDVIVAEENILTSMEESDNTTISNLTLLDKIEMATITINIYQRQAIKREMVFNEKSLKGYEPGFGFKIGQSLISGWRALEAVILFVLRFWVLFVIGIAGVLFWRWWSRR